MDSRELEDYIIQHVSNHYSNERKPETEKQTNEFVVFGNRHIQANTLTEKDISNLCAAINIYPLDVLALCNMDLSDEEICSILSEVFLKDSPPHTLSLSFNLMSDRSAILLANFLKTDNRVKNIILHSNHIGDEGLAALASALTINTGVTTFEIYNNTFTQEARAAFEAALQGKCHLEKLLLYVDPATGRAMTGALAKTIERNKFFTELNKCITEKRELWSFTGDAALRASILNKDDFTLLAALIRQHKPKALSLNNLFLTDSDTKHLLHELASTPSLQSLTLVNNNLSDHGAKTIADMLVSHKTLLKLSLAENQITDEGAHLIANSLIANNVLRSLNLSGNAVTSHLNDKFRRVLKTNLALEKIILFTNPAAQEQLNIHLNAELSRNMRSHAKQANNMQKLSLLNQRRLRESEHSVSAPVFSAYKKV